LNATVPWRQTGPFHANKLQLTSNEEVSQVLQTETDRADPTEKVRVLRAKKELEFKAHLKMTDFSEYVISAHVDYFLHKDSAKFRVTHHVDKGANYVNICAKKLAKSAFTQNIHMYPCTKNQKKKSRHSFCQKVESK
jgi:hypothetical protein